MCGIAAAFGIPDAGDAVGRMNARLAHRGPDSFDSIAMREGALGHRRLSIIDLSPAGQQPMTDASGRYTIVFNGEVYNYLELREELSDYPFRSRTDSEVVLAAWAQWGAAALDRFIGMFAFIVWDRETKSLTAGRDRLGVKPLYFAEHRGGIVLASEIKALHAAGVPAEQDAGAWATFLARGQHDHGTRTFWRGVSAVPAGSMLRWSAGTASIERWYDLAARVGEAYDTRDEATVREEYTALLEQSVRYRFRSDVPVGINLSGGLDSSLLLGLVHAIQGADSDVKVFSFATGDERYDELPWVQAMLEATRHPLHACMLTPADVPALAAKISAFEDEPFGGLPTLAYARLFEHARAAGVIVLLDGQGMDEQWAGYDYYHAQTADAPVVQGTADPALLPDCLAPEFAALAEASPAPTPFHDRLRNLQYRDLLQTKLPRALRYNDRVSMASSTELREPFLDHRLIELAMRQPPERKLRGDTGKVMLRDIAARLLPERVRVAPKRPLQTPQREWLRGPLAGWATSLIEHALAVHPGWFVADKVRARWNAFRDGAGDNSFWVWQWISAGSAWTQESV